ncbi:hypothetical protein KY290_007717 [Solanum tuberosum]|uniref:Uncharacterized protein n=1 Tax=Solanum tuberosum TaxID=4113 RepID=A0ABQ7W6D3_SOLTU|nr:hypothetical protein KY290_007717 [Solanum tuberosum]
MAKKSSKKSKTKKEAHAKTPKKRGRKVSPAISRSALPTNMNYVVKQIPNHSLKFGSTYNTNFIRDLALPIGIRRWSRTIQPENFIFVIK